jgi:hypothetical protein
MSETFETAPDQPQPKSITEIQAWLCTSMAAGSFVAVTQLATRSDLNLWHRVAVGLFALSLPIFIVILAVWKMDAVFSEQREKDFENAQTAGTSMFFFGILCLFGSFGGIYGGIYCAAIFISTLCASRLFHGTMVKTPAETALNSKTSSAPDANDSPAASSSKKNG